jgi:hypothetical protein
MTAQTRPPSRFEQQQFSKADRSKEVDRAGVDPKSKPGSGEGSRTALAAWKQVERARQWWRTFRR